MPNSTLKLVDTKEEYTYQRLADIAEEVRQESVVDIVADPLEITRLQTEVEDMREENAVLLRALNQANSWAAGWKYAATVNWKARRRLQQQCSAYQEDSRVEHQKLMDAQQSARAWKLAAMINRKAKKQRQLTIYDLRAEINVLELAAKRKEEAD